MDIKQEKPSVFYISLLFIVSLIITLNWFRNGLLFATAEEGMPFYAPQRTAFLDSSAWQMDGAGYLNTSILPRYPAMLISGFLNSFFPANIVQALFFLFIVFSGLTGTFFLAKYFVKEKSKSLIVSLFYLLNLFTMSQVFARALFVLMVVWAFLPWFIFLYLKILEGKNKVWLVLFMVFQIIFSYSYIFPTSIFVFWIPSGIILFFKIGENFKNRKVLLKLIRRALAVGLLWAIVNLWWIYPFVKLAGDSFSGSSSKESNIESLQGVSTNFPIPQILQLRQKYYFNYSANSELSWGPFYDSEISYLISTLGFLIVLVGIIKARRNKHFIYLITIFLVALFICKGTNRPFGLTFYKWLFNSFYFTGIFRNSYEKLGLVFVLPYSIYFGIGIFGILDLFKKVKIKISALIIFLFLFFVYLINPIWTGKVFWDYYWVKVPQYYQEANNYLNNDPADFRILILPLIPSHGARYSWGYRGDEPSRFIFDKNVISRRLNNYYVTKYDEITNNINSHKSINYLLDQSNIKYLVLNHDIDVKAVGSQDPEVVGQFLRNQEDIEFIKSYGSLEVFKYTNLSPTSLFVKDDGEVNHLTYKKLNNRHYKIYISNAKIPFNLIFKETFNKNWTAKVNNEPVDSHNLAYEYANGWKINKTGDFEIDVIFKIWPWE